MQSSVSVQFLEKFISPKTCFRVRVELGLGLAEIRFRSNVSSSKCTRSV